VWRIVEVDPELLVPYLLEEPEREMSELVERHLRP
jgi:hypothetical protein